MADEAPGDASGSSDRLESAIRELRAQVTEDVLNLRARLLAVEQELQAIRRGGELREEQPPEEQPPRRRQRAEGRAKRGRRATGEGGAKRAGRAQRKARRRPAADDEPPSGEQ